MYRGNKLNRIGIDLGGTKIEGILIGDDDQVLERKRITTNRDEGYNTIIERIAKLINELRTISESPVKIGVCTPGAISPQTGRIKNSNTVCLIGQPLKEDIESLIQQQIKMENDANCFAIAEALRGSARGYDTVFGVIIGTGVGGGIVMNGKIHQGRMAIAGEWGHHTLYPNGRQCYCGKKGCVETYIGGPSLEKRWIELSGKALPLAKIIKNDNKSTIFKKWKKEFVKNFGIALANVIDILDPDAIVLGGGVSNIDFLYDEGKQAIYNHVFSDFVDTPVLKNKLGDSAGVFGAADL